MVAGAQAKMRPSTGREINVLNEQPAILDRLDDQISWYDRKSQSAQKRYKVLKLVQVVAPWPSDHIADKSAKSKRGG